MPTIMKKANRYSSLIALTLLAILPLWSLEPSAAEVIRFKLLPEESEILTEISHTFGPVKGTFKLRKGEALGNPEDLQGSGQVRISIGTSTYDTGLAPRDEDVVENYLETDRYPEITFASVAIENVNPQVSIGGTWELIIRGRLKLHGHEKEVRIPVKLTRSGNRVIVEGSTTILLKDFNIAVPKLLFIRSGDRARVRFRFTAEQF